MHPKDIAPAHPQTRRVRLKIERGAQCEMCGYDRCLRALHFHHVDGATKKTWSKRGEASVDEIVAHPGRFVLLCANCHIEEHERRDEAKRVYLTCLTCAMPYPSRPCLRAADRSHYCSRACQAIGTSKAGVPVETRVWRHIEKTATCWLWTGYRLAHGGYAQVQTSPQRGQRRAILVHRLMYEAVHGTIPHGAQVHHSCGVKHCVNPEHLTMAGSPQRTDAPTLS